jgi:hypothetical protein
MLAELRRSYARLPRAPRPRLEVCLAGYFRISHTEPLIRRALDRCVTARDRRFWADALTGEAGHAALYFEDLVAAFGADVAEAIRDYRPCPAILSLLEWADSAFLNGALYRLYLEYLVAARPDLIEGLAAALPKSVAVHRAADRAHWRETHRYVAQLGGDRLAVPRIERALAAEMGHRGLFVEANAGE